MASYLFTGGRLLDTRRGAVLLTARAGVLARNMLMRGFTTVRDTGGAFVKQALGG